MVVSKAGVRTASSVPTRSHGSLIGVLTRATATSSRARPLLVPEVGELRRAVGVGRDDLPGCRRSRMRRATHPERMMLRSLGGAYVMCR